MRSIAAALSAAALTLAAPAGADVFPRWEDSLYLPVGLDLGAAIHPAPSLKSSFLVGGDLSVVYIDKDELWIGGFADALADVSNKAFRYCVGPELGLGFFGLDVGYMGEVRAGAYHNGLAMRVHLTMSLVGVYGRWGHVFDDPQELNFGEVGVLLKFPFPLWKKMPEYPSSGPPPAPPAPQAPPVPPGPVQKLPEAPPAGG